MSEKKKIRIGLIGTGLMGRIHTNGYKRLGDFFLNMSTVRSCKPHVPEGKIKLKNLQNSGAMPPMKQIGEK